MPLNKESKKEKSTMMLGHRAIALLAATAAFASGGCDAFVPPHHQPGGAAGLSSTTPVSRLILSATVRVVENCSVVPGNVTRCACPHYRAGNILSTSFHIPTTHALTLSCRLSFWILSSASALHPEILLDEQVEPRLGCQQRSYDRKQQFLLVHHERSAAAGCGAALAVFRAASATTGACGSFL